MKPAPAKNTKPLIHLNRKGYSPMEIAVPVGICVATLICFSYTFSNQFLFWDDNQFILNNIYLRRFSWGNISYLISHEFGANWQPFTMLSYSLNYYFSKYTPFGYFFTNVLLHVANTLLVFFIIRNLMNLFWKNTKPEQALIVSGIISLWFGIHPMHVESVGWLFERKDVLYTLFYLTGLFLYIKYLKGEKTKGLLIFNIVLTLLFFWAIFGLSSYSYHFAIVLFDITIQSHHFTTGPLNIIIRPSIIFAILTVIFGGAILVELKFKHIKIELFYVFEFFLFSLLSKPMAVVFPLSLLLIDFLLSRKFKKNIFIEKIFFLAISLIIGFLTLHTQKEAHAFIYSFSITDRFFIASYSFLEYIFKLFFPIHLSGFYPYPMNPGESLPSYFYIMPLLVLLITALPLYLTYKKNPVSFKILVFGFGFYLVNIALVLQFLSVGSAIISDRYSYMSYIGLLFILAYFLNQLFQRNNVSLKNAVLIVGVLFSVYFGYLCYERTRAWHDTEAMLTDVINQYPEKVPQAYKYLGIYYAENGRTKDAFNCYDVLINKMHLKDADAYCNMGAVFMSLGNLKEAAKYLSASLQIDSTLFMSYRDLGKICADTGNYTEAFRYYEKANSIFPNDEGLYFDISLAHVAMKNYAQAINDYNLLIQMNPDNALYYFNRGVAEYSMGNIVNATEDFTKTLSMPVTKQNASYHLNASAAHNLSVIYKDKGDNQKATDYESVAKQLGN